MATTHYQCLHFFFLYYFWPELKKLRMLSHISAVCFFQKTDIILDIWRADQGKQVTDCNIFRRPSFPLGCTKLSWTIRITANGFFFFRAACAHFWHQYLETIETITWYALLHLWKIYFSSRAESRLLYTQTPIPLYKTFLGIEVTERRK